MAVAVVDSVAVEVAAIVAAAEEVESVQYWSAAAAAAFAAAAAVDSQSAGQEPRFVVHSVVLPETFAVVVAVAAVVESKRYSLSSHLAERN